MNGSTRSKLFLGISSGIYFSTFLLGLTALPPGPWTHTVMAAVEKNPAQSNRSTQKAPAIKSIGTVSDVSGNAWIIRNSKKIPAQAGEPVFDGEDIITEDGAQVKLVLTKKEAAFLVKKESHLNIRKTSPDSWWIDLDHGMLLSYVKPSPSSSLKSRFQVKTRNAVMGVRGTIFFIKAEPNKDVFLCTCSGMVSIDNKAIIIGKHHDSPKLIKAGPQPLAKRLLATEKGEDHTDAEAAALAKLIE